MVALGCSFVLDVFTIAEQDRPFAEPVPLPHTPVRLSGSKPFSLGLQQSVRVDVHGCCPGPPAARVFMKVPTNLNNLGLLGDWTFLPAILRASLSYGAL